MIKVGIIGGAGYTAGELIRILLTHPGAELKSIQSIRNAHQIIFNNDLNKTIKLLTSFTIIMTIPTIIASLYGMNISLPLSDHPVAFGIIMLIIFGLSILGIVIFRLLRWL